MDRRISAIWDAGCPGFGRGIAGLDEGQKAWRFETPLLRPPETGGAGNPRGRRRRGGGEEVHVQLGVGWERVPIRSFVGSKLRWEGRTCNYGNYGVVR